MARASKLKAAPGSIYRANKKVVELTTKKAEAVKISSHQEHSILTKSPDFDYINTDVYQLFEPIEYPDCTYITSTGWVDVADACLFIADIEIDHDTNVMGGTVGATLDIYLKTQAVCRRCSDPFYANPQDCEDFGGIWYGELNWTEAACTGEGHSWYDGNLNTISLELHKANEELPHGNQYIENVSVTLDPSSDVYPGGTGYVGYIAPFLADDDNYGIVYFAGQNEPIPSLGGEGIFAKVTFELDGTLDNAWQGLCIRNFVGQISEDPLYTVKLNNSSVEDPWVGNSARTCTGACSCPTETPTMLTCLRGDLTGDYQWNIMDVVAMADCIYWSSCSNQEPANTIWCTSNLVSTPDVDVVDLVALINCIYFQNCGESLNGDLALDQVAGVYASPDGMTDEEHQILLGKIKKIASKYTTRPDSKAGVREIYDFINKDSLLSSSLNGNIHNTKVTKQTKDSLEFSWNNSCTNCDGSLVDLTTSPIVSTTQSAYGNNSLTSKDVRINNSLSSIQKRMNKIMFGEDNTIPDNLIGYPDSKCYGFLEYGEGLNYGRWEEAQVCLTLKNVDPYAGTLEINMKNKTSCQWCSDPFHNTNREECETYSGVWYVNYNGYTEESCQYHHEGLWYNGEVAGVQFDLHGMTVTGVTGGTSNVFDQIAYNTPEQNETTYNTFLLFSTGGTFIPPGDETLIQISFDPATLGEEFLESFISQQGRICMNELIISNSDGQEMFANNGIYVPDGSGNYIMGPNCFNCHCPEIFSGATFDCLRGDINADGYWTIADLLNLIHCVIGQYCTDSPCPSMNDINGDGIYNVLDIATLINCVLAQDCGEELNGDAGLDTPAAYRVPYGFTETEHTELIQELRTAITQYSADLRKDNSKIAFNSLSADTTYYLNNTFFNAYGKSETFQFQTSTLSEPPDAAPTSLSFSGNSQTGINLFWVNNCSNEKEVRIFLDDLDYGFKPFNAIATLLPGSTSYTFAGLTADTDYNVWVDFYNTGGNRGITGEFTTLETGPDNSPGNLAFANPAGVGATTLHLMWSNNASNEDGIHIYRNSIDVKPGTPYSTINATSPNQCYDSDAGCTGAVGSGLTPNTEYFYWISFFNTGGESNTTSGSTFTFEVAPDAAPSNLTFVPGATSIALTFTNNATNDDGVKIYRDTSLPKPVIPLYNLTGTNITSYTDDSSGSGLTEGTTYYYWVSNYNEIAESSTVSGATTTQTSGTTWYHAHGGAMELQANAISTAGNIRLNNSISTSTPPTITTGDYIKIDDEEMLVGVINHPSRPNVTRGVNGTTAAFHFAGSDVYVDHNTDGT